MPTLPTRSFAVIVQNTVAGIQGRAAELIDFSKGSPLLAIVEGFAGFGLWLQALFLRLLTAIRLSTSSGLDVDSFCADFMPVVAGTNSPRLGAQKASGLVAFSRFTAAPASCFIPVGSTVTTSDRSVSFAVTADPTFPTYSASPAGYTLASAVASITVPVEAQTAGSLGNVAEGAISVITSSIQGIDAVVNNAAFDNGADQESDAALKKRFSAFIMGLARGDNFGLAAAIEGAETILQWQVVENYTLQGAWNPGYYFVVADDGSGAPSSTFLQTVTDAVMSVRPLGQQAAVFAPSIVWAGVSLQIQTVSGYDHNTLVGLVANAIADGINGLGLGNDLDFNRIAAWAYAVPGVTGVKDVQINGASGDGASLSASVTTQDGLKHMPIHTIKTNSVVVS